MNLMQRWRHWLSVGLCKHIASSVDDGQKDGRDRDDTTPASKHLHCPATNAVAEWRPECYREVRSSTFMITYVMMGSVVRRTCWGSFVGDDVLSGFRVRFVIEDVQKRNQWFALVVLKYNRPTLLFLLFFYHS